MDKYEEIGEKLLREHIEFIPFSEILNRAITELDETNSEDVVSFGYDFMDDKLTGLFKGELVVIGGETGTGKTTFATNILYKASEKNRCSIFALEDRLNDYGIKAIYFEIGRLRYAQGKKNYPWNSYRKNEIEDPAYKIIREQARKNIDNSNLHFADVKAQMNIDMLERAITNEIALGSKLFLIDHLHYFDLASGDSTKADYIEQVMVRLKGIQNQTGARVIMIVHYKKLNGIKPTLDSFKDSASISQNANYVINLWRDRSMSDENTSQYDTHMYVPKSRNPNGECSFELTFNPDINDYVFKKVSFGSPLEESLERKYAKF